jgi:acyl-CoA synthetase (NDP forming)/RimJ/RimL family protein N-acetyltransferase
VAADVPDPDDPYPSRWEADVVLRDGGTAHLRPIRPEDAEGLQRFHLRQSPESVYLRFFAPMPELSASDARHFAHVDHRRRVAFVITLGDDIVGIGRYEQTDDTTAEVAFNVSDAHQGRGLGSVLLEHLAAAARENGVHRFVAEVLPQNRKMVGVFRDAGYEVRSDYDDGVIALTFDIDPTERSLAVMEAREHRAEALSMQVLMQPRSVAVIGASRRSGTIGHRLLADLLAGGFSGAVHVVHPVADAVLGVPAVPTIRDVEGGADLAVIAVPAEGVLDVVRECAASGVHGLVVVSAGFAETGARGLARQRELVRVARANGLRVIGPNSWGVINADPQVRLNVSLVETLPAHGRFGLFSQSGGLSVAVLDAVRRRGIGLSTFLSAGNRADVSGNDCLQYWEEDPATDVVGLYLESVGNPRKFSRIARRLARKKPVVVVKSGTSNFGTPPGHAVRPSRAPQEAFDAMLRQSGCIRVETPRQMLDVAQLLLSQPLPGGRRVAVVGNSDALGALIADACTSWDLDVVHGPVSVPSQATPQEFKKALRDAFGDPSVDAVAVAFIPPVRTPGEEVAQVLAEAAARSDKPVVACLLGMDGVVDHLQQLVLKPPHRPPHPETTEVVPSYAVPEEAVRALAAVTRYAEWRRRDPGHRVAPAGMDLDAAHVLVRDLLAARPADGTESPVPLDDATTARLLALAGVELWPSVPVPDAASAVAAARELGFPVALKTSAPHLRHRVDLGGVRLDIAGEQELEADYEQMRARLTPLGGGELVVQKMAPLGVACVVRSVEDPLFGPVVSFGLGGDASELLGDVAHRIPPLTDVDVADLVRSTRASPKLFGHRGAAPVDVAALEDVVARVSSLADVLPEVAELELNPVVVSTAGAHVLGATVRLARPPGRADASSRRLTEG